jgi:hypothetical protein
MPNIAYNATRIVYNANHIAYNANHIVYNANHTAYNANHIRVTVVEGACSVRELARDSFSRWIDNAPDG